MKKDLTLVSIMLDIGILLLLLEITGMVAHIILSVVGVIVLVMCTIVSKKEWKIPVLEIIMRVFYGITLILGIVMMNVKDVLALKIAHNACALIFFIPLIILFIHKIVISKKSK